MDNALSLDVGAGIKPARVQKTLIKDMTSAYLFRYQLGKIPMQLILEFKKFGDIGRDMVSVE